MHIKSLTATLIMICLFLSACSSSYAIEWSYSFDEAIEKAQAEDKPIMADFFANWCGYCKKLDRETFANTTVDALSDKFVCVKIDTDKNQDLSKKYGVRGLPTVVFFDKEGKEINRIVGFRGPDDFVKTMEEVIGE